MNESLSNPFEMRSDTQEAISMGARSLGSRSSIALVASDSCRTSEPVGCAACAKCLIPDHLKIPALNSRLAEARFRSHGYLIVNRRVSLIHIRVELFHVRHEAVIDIHSFVIWRILYEMVGNLIENKRVRFLILLTRFGPFPARV